MNIIEKYDRLLYIDKDLDGSKKIYRKSIFKSSEEFPILKIENQFVGSGRWVRNKLMSMDTQRLPIVSDILMHNKKKQKEKQNNNMTVDIANFMVTGGQLFIN
jgi:hypothetical protein